jgi:hypothetical protein
MLIRFAAALLALAGFVPAHAGSAAPPPLAATSAPPPPPSSGLFTYRDPQINESSGLAASSFDDTFYTHNDSGDFARFFRVDARGDTVAVYTLVGATNVDWEDMATGVVAGKPVLYFGDTGDNNRDRKEIAVYQVPEPRGPSADVTWTKYRFAYPDGAHDAEALLVDPRSHRIYIATKELLSNGRLYAAPPVPSTTAVNVLSPAGSVPPLTTAGDFAPDGSRVVVLTYIGAFWADDVGAAWHRFDVPLPRQAEAIAYTRDGASVLVGGEGVHSAVYRAPAPERTPAEVVSSPSASRVGPATTSPSARVADREAGPSEVALVLIAVAIVGGVSAAGILVVRARRNR